MVLHHWLYNRQFVPVDHDIRPADNEHSILSLFHFTIMLNICLLIGDFINTKNIFKASPRTISLFWPIRSSVALVSHVKQAAHCENNTDHVATAFWTGSTLISSQRLQPTPYPMRVKGSNTWEEQWTWKKQIKTAQNNSHVEREKIMAVNIYIKY